MALRVPIVLLGFAKDAQKYSPECAMVFDRECDRESIDNALSWHRFINACHIYEREYGNRASNDYRRTR